MARNTYSSGGRGTRSNVPPSVHGQPAARGATGAPTRKRIEVSAETKKALDNLRRTGETYDAAIQRLIAAAASGGVIPGATPMGPLPEELDTVTSGQPGSLEPLAPPPNRG